MRPSRMNCSGTCNSCSSEKTPSWLSSLIGGYAALISISTKTNSVSLGLITLCSTPSGRV
ncbi:Uncharacterised protein [Bordetella pertussis]|nr:Uncharacterised protein [Bordetella pertussis]